MRVFLGTIIISFFFYSVALSEILLPECEGNDNNISTFFLEQPSELGKLKKLISKSKAWKNYLAHYKKTRKWTECQGTGMGPRGEKYIGEWKKGKFHGSGTFAHDGREFNGLWQKGKKNGIGTYKYTNGDMYVGEWKESKYSKSGTYIYANGDKYSGEWKKDEYNIPDNQLERHGTGIYTYINGDIYDGNWKMGLKHGKGIYTYANEKIQKGIWKKDKFVK